MRLYLRRENVEKPEANVDSSFCPLYECLSHDFASWFSHYSNGIVSCE